MRSGAHQQGQRVRSVLLDVAQRRTGGSNTFICPPSGASIVKYVSSLENCFDREGTEKAR